MAAKGWTYAQVAEMSPEQQVRAYAQVHEDQTTIKFDSQAEHAAWLRREKT